jgi:hypothetical protein
MANSTVLFDCPQQEIASLITDRMNRASAISIVTGFATPGGLATLIGPIKANPFVLKTLVLGASTYPGFEVLDNLLSSGVPRDRLHVHLGHTNATGGKKHPYARFRPMLHSKVYYIEFSDGTACAIIGSHNVTAFALNGLNGEAAVLVEGEIADPEFQKVREHIATAQAQSAEYDPSMKEAFAWWAREFLEGLKSEIKIPQDWISTRTILLFATAPSGKLPVIDDQLYFEIPAGIEHIDSLKTETHLFLFDTLPTDPRQALSLAHTAIARYKCKTLGVENQQGNKELEAQWRIDGSLRPKLIPVPSATYRPSPPTGMQQVRACIVERYIDNFEYLFERENKVWYPALSSDDELKLKIEQLEPAVLAESSYGMRINNWKLVKGLSQSEGAPRETDAVALELASPDSGSFILVSLRRRDRNKVYKS